MDIVSCFYLTQKFELDRMLKMLFHFHPEVNIDIMNEADLRKNNLLFSARTYPEVGKFLSSTYDTITHIDADVLIVDRIDELLDNESDARAGRNNSDNHKAGTNLAFTNPSLDSNLYVNAGIHSVTNHLFWEDWLSGCIDHSDKVTFAEQGILSELFNSGKYNSILLDPIDSNVYYGTSCLYGNITHWDSWKEIIVKDNKLYLNNKLIKMLHFAGGGVKPPIENLFTKDVLDFVNNIIY
jgi:hypothetical protein